jgi:hypothetical protein
VEVLELIRRGLLVFVGSVPQEVGERRQVTVEALNSTRKLLILPSSIVEVEHPETQPQKKSQGDSRPQV